MDKKIDYGRFPRLRAVVAESGLETQEEQERAFKSLVNCLVSKMVCRPDGSIVNFRSTCLSYFAQICPHLELEELELMINSAESFYQRFIFAPCEKAKSLYSEFQKLGVKSKFKDIPVSEIYKEYRQQTGNSPYEKTSKLEISSFLDSIEPSMYALAGDLWCGVYLHTFFIILDLTLVICIKYVFIFGLYLMNYLKSALLLFIPGIFLCGSFSYAAGNQFVRRLLGTQLEIGLNQRSSVGEFRDGRAGNSLALLQETSSQNKFDLISELDRAKTEQERLVIIDQYIVSLNNTISNGKNLGNYEQSQVDYYNNEAKKCESPIKSKNSEFSEAVKNYNYERAEAISKEIADLRACVARNEVYAKAHASYASSSKSLATLQKRADYLSKNREKIAKYYEILKPDLLKELYDISKTVEDF